MTTLTKDPIDKRDHLYQAVGKIVNLPESVDLRVFDRDGIHNQSYSNSCVANAICSVIEIMLSRAGKFRDLSRLYHYYWARSVTGRQNVDGGTNMRVCMSAVRDMGLCSEATWPFDLSKVNDKPPENCTAEAKPLSGGEYCNIVVDHQNLMCALAEGHAIAFASDLQPEWFNVDGASLEETADYITKNCMHSNTSAGSHAMTLVGYRQYNGKLHYIVENSWGDGWGYNGHALMPAGRIAYCGDFWIMHSIPGITLPTIWVPQLEGQKPKPIKPVRPKEREVAPNGKKHTLFCTLRRWTQARFGKKVTCGCGAER